MPRSESKPKVGDKIETWFSDQPDHLSTILSVSPYNGKYKDWFKWDIRATAPRTDNGWLEFCI